MDNRTRFTNILEGKPIDRMPAVHFGYWRELLIDWANEGHISHALARSVYACNHFDRILDKILGWDFCYNVRCSPISCIFPTFLKKKIEVTPEGTLVRSYLGVTELHKKGTNGIPAEVGYLLKDRESYEKYYKNKIKYKKIRNVGDRLLYTLANKTNPLGLFAGSSLGTIRSMCTLIGLSYLMYDDPDLLKEIVDDWNDMQYECLKTNLEKGFKYDFIHFWEDMCFNKGPLISPDIYYDLCFKHYKKMADLAHQYGIKYISLDCDGDFRLLAKMWEEAGINIMFPIEYGTWELDIKKVREVAPTLYGVGGMNKNVLSKDKAAVDEEIERLKPLVKLGGYIPCPDHLLPQGTKFELVKYYTSQVKKILD
ncbi:MAG: uroporphyrinogen decarboxylase family protein [Clostridia bacterium]|jgi:uroporphyrinogen decarboxylase|nr:uroporphyrinogen decarboxylase family protein [Clostridia bacterium]